MATQGAFTTEEWTSGIRFTPGSSANGRRADEVLCKHNVVKEYS